MISLLDFVTPATAFMRCISGAFPVTFRLSPEGRITGLVMTGFGAFLKTAPDANAGFLRVSVPGVSGAWKLSILLPKEWTILERSGVLVASSPDGEVSMTVRLVSGRRTAPEAGQDDARYEMRAGFLWRGDIRIVTAETVAGNTRLEVTLEASRDRVTAAVREALLPLMNGAREG